MNQRTAIDVYDDNGEYVAVWKDEEYRASNPFGLDSRLEAAGAPVGRDLTFQGEWKTRD